MYLRAIGMEGGSVLMMSLSCAVIYANFDLVAWIIAACISLKIALKVYFIHAKNHMYHAGANGAHASF